MAESCANNWCTTVRRRNEGKLFRLDIDLGSLSGRDERKTEYVWLCASCAQVMHPKVVVTGDTVTLRLTKNEPMRPPLEGTSAVLKWANWVFPEAYQMLLQSVETMTWLVLLRWSFRGENKTELVIHAKDQREAEERVYKILPSTFFRAANFEIAMAPTHTILQAPELVNSTQ
jgi:hypothetical protein